ncbi:N-acetylmuramoyl-L-alanine amidase [Prevotella copri]|uniref:N-acetylmuramoyl-L-alanine amidase n=1 Tax=Segatella copri TaxID=165179 RepID=A0A6G1VJS5_9BACT|nr:N-acetylmuramoyl-L-alanine amidase [Segatella copri]MQP13272.1 N-acetylmuramoyl-L-alanine amidase [Segatella copri]
MFIGIRCRSLKQKYGEYPEASIHGHNEFASKDCPCFDVKEEWGE